MTATVAFCSSIYTAAIEAIAVHYQCSRLVSTLGVSTFLLGFAAGPLLFAPLSEIWSVIHQKASVYRIAWLIWLGVETRSSGLPCCCFSSHRLAVL